MTMRGWVARRKDVFSWADPQIMGRMLLDKGGAFIEGGFVLMRTPYMRGRSDEEVESQKVMFSAVWHAISLLNCKNVSTIDHEPPEKLARRCEREGKPPGTVFKTLVVKLPGTRETVRLGGMGTGVKRGQHIVRGHFKTYGNSNKLFGRLTGTFYHPMHVRGTNRERKIIKDYRLVKDEAA